MNELQVVTQLDQSINDAHGRALGIARSVRDSVLSYANEMRACGLLLEIRKKQTRHGNAKGEGGWVKLFASSRGKIQTDWIFAFDWQTGQNYMRLAKLHPDEFTTIEEAREFLKLINSTAGVIEDASPRDPQSSHDFNFAAEVISIASRLDALWNKHKGDEFLASLPSHAKEQIADKIEPVKARIDEIWRAVNQ